MTKCHFESMIALVYCHVNFLLNGALNICVATLVIIEQLVSIKNIQLLDIRNSLPPEMHLKVILPKGMPIRDGQMR